MCGTQQKTNICDVYEEYLVDICVIILQKESRNIKLGIKVYWLNKVGSLI